MSGHDEDTRSAEFLHSLGYLYMRGGQPSRALVFLLIAHRIEPADPGILRTLAAVFIETGSGERALGVLEQLTRVEEEPSSSALLLRSRALWVLGEEIEARRTFRDYLERRQPS